MARKNRPRDFDRTRTPPPVGQAGEIPSPSESPSESSSADSKSDTLHGSSLATANSRPPAKNSVGDPATVSGGVPSPRRKRSGGTSGGSSASELEQTLAFVAAVGGFDKAKALVSAAERIAGQVRKLLDARPFEE